MTPLTTKTLADSVTSDGGTDPVSIPCGQYLLALSGEFGGATVQLHVNIGKATAVPITDAAYTAPSGEVVWLPNCTAYVVTTSASASTNVTVAIAELSTALD